MSELRKLAAGEKAWCEARMVQYREDGAPPPEPIRRLSILADLALAETPGGVAVTGDAGSNGREIAKLGTWLLEHYPGEMRNYVEGDVSAASTAIKLLDRARETQNGLSMIAKERDEIRSRSALALRESASVLTSVANALVSEGEYGIGRETPVASPGALLPLRHGLVVVSRDGNPRCVLLSEPRPGGWVAQAVDIPNKALGPETSIDPFAWLANEWCGAVIDGLADIAVNGPAHWSAAQRPAAAPVVAQDTTAPAKGEQTVIPGAGPATPPPEGPKTCGQWEPTDRDIASSAVALNDALSKVGLPKTVDDAKVRELLASFKADPVKSVLASAKPGTVFYYYAVKALKEAHAAQNEAAT